MNVKPTDTIQRALLSTTSRFVGEYDRPGVYLTHAWSFGSIRDMPGPASRNAFVLSFATLPIEGRPGVVIPNYSYRGRRMCGVLAVLFGKRFDFHGMTQGTGNFEVPDLSLFGQLSNPQLPQNTHKVRANFAVPLNLGELSRLEALVMSDDDDHARRTFHSSAKFYVQALQNIERDPEVAYLHLISSIEILSGFYDYPKEELWDSDLAALLARIREGMTDGEKVARQVGARLHQIKRAFVRTVTDLIDDEFFASNDCREPNYGLKADDFPRRIAAAYDLRSQYVHTGSPFGNWIDRPNEERCFGRPAYLEPSLATTIERAPTYIGLERVVRYCLIRFLEKVGIYTPPHGPPRPATE